MTNDLPPGVTESMIPGSRPEDEEIEVTIVFTVGEIEELCSYNDAQQRLLLPQRDRLWAVISNITEQLG